MGREEQARYRTATWGPPWLGLSCPSIEARASVLPDMRGGSPGRWEWRAPEAQGVIVASPPPLSGQGQTPLGRKAGEGKAG